MLKRPIKYTDLDDNEVTEDFYFNLSKPEIIEMEVEHKQGFKERIEQIIKTEDRKTLVEEFKKLILLTYGVKSEDGKRFIKSEQLREEFSQTPAYEELFMDLASNDGAASEFIIGVLPRDMRDEAAKAVTAVTPPPASPTPPTPPLPPSGV